MAHVKTVLSVAASIVLYATALPGTTSALTGDGQMLLAAGQGAQTGTKQQAQTPRGDQIQDRTRLRLDPQGTPNPEPPGKNPRGMDMQSDQQQDRIRDRQRLDPQGTPNPEPPGMNPRDVELQGDPDQERDRTRQRLDPQGTPNETPGENNPR